MSPIIVIAADILVVVLLVATIATSVRLSRQLARMKADEAAMRMTIAELGSATDSAERAIAGLRNTLTECDQTLGERLRTAERYTGDVTRAVAAGDKLMSQIDHLMDMTRRAVQSHAPGSAVPVASPPRGGEALRAAVATAKAVAERAARRIESRAA